MATAAGKGFRWNAERAFYTGYALWLVLMVALGFGPSWAHRAATASGPQAMTPLIWVHGLVFIGWVLLFLVQTSLIATRNTQWHKRAGYASVALAVAMLALGVKVAAMQKARGSVPPSLDPETWFAAPMFDLLVFAGLFIAGLLWRRNAQAHKRLMLGATIVFLYAAVGRLTFLPPELLGGEWTTVLAAAMMLPLVAWDLKQRGRVHPATVAVLAALLGDPILRLLVWHSDAWHTISGGIIAALG